MKRTITAIALAALLALASAGCQGSDSAGESGQEASGDEAVATLQDYTVTLDDYTFYYRWIQDQMEYQAMMLGGYDESNIDEYWNLDQGTGPMKDMVSQEALNMGKQYAILYKIAVDEGFKLDQEMEKQIEDEVNSSLEQANNDEAQFEATYGFGSDLMRRTYAKLEVVNLYLDNAKAGIEVSGEEIDADYQKVEDERAAAKAKADDLLSQIEGGTPIGDLVAENTDDTASIETEGEYTFGRGEMVTEFEEWAFNAEPGDRGVVETDYGYHVMELIEKLDQDSETEEYARVTVRHILISCTESVTKEAIEETVRDTKLNELMEGILEPVGSEEWVVNQELVDTLTVVDENAPIGSITGDEIPREMPQSSEAAQSEAPAGGSASE